MLQVRKAVVDVNFVTCKFSQAELVSTVTIAQGRATIKLRNDTLTANIPV